MADINSLTNDLDERLSLADGESYVANSNTSGCLSSNQFDAGHSSSSIVCDHPSPDLPTSSSGSSYCQTRNTYLTPLSVVSMATGGANDIPDEAVVVPAVTRVLRPRCSRGRDAGVLDQPAAVDLSAAASEPMVDRVRHPAILAGSAASHSQSELARMAVQIPPVAVGADHEPSSVDVSDCNGRCSTIEPREPDECLRTLDRTGASADSSQPSDVCHLECSICLQPCIHPVQLPCSHVFCFLCAKGAAASAGARRCAMCRADVPQDFLDRPRLLDDKQLQRAMKASDDFCWFYEGASGWWQYEERASELLERAFAAEEKSCQLLLAGHLYLVNFDEMMQRRSSNTARKRRVKRDLASADKEGVAGLRPANLRR